MSNFMILNNDPRRYASTELATCGSSEAARAVRVAEVTPASARTPNLSGWTCTSRREGPLGFSQVTRHLRSARHRPKGCEMARGRRAEGLSLLSLS